MQTSTHRQKLFSLRKLFSPRRSYTGTVDLRSDTVTQPSKAMREAMSTAKVGDDVYGEDPTVISLEKRCSVLFGKEAALFVPSGTMANLIAVMGHCRNRGSELITGHKQHIVKYEQVGFAQFAGIGASLVPNQMDGTIAEEDIEGAVRDETDIHQPISRLLVLENTHNVCGGIPLSAAYMEKVRRIADKHKLLIHVDGARVCNAAVAQKTTIEELVRAADSSSMCFSKGLGCPVGSILTGSAEFIHLARRLRKGLGGGMRQSGVLAATALVALDCMEERIKQDHANARFLAEQLMSREINPNGLLSIDLNMVKTNIIILKLSPDAGRLNEFCKKLSQPSSDLPRVLCSPWTKDSVRLVVHCDAGRADLEKALLTFAAVLKTL